MAASALLSRRPELVADLALVGVTAIWGSTFIVNRLVLETTPPLLFLLFRFGLGAMVLLLLARGRPRTPGLFKDSLVLGILLALGIGCQVAGQLFTTASKAAFITGLSVPLTPVVAYLAARRRPTPENLVGLLVAAAGFSLMAFPADMKGLQIGDLLILGTAITYAYLIHYLAETSPRHDARWYSAGQTAVAAVAVGISRLALSPFLGRHEAFLAAEGRSFHLTKGLVLALLWMSLAATALTFVLQTWAQARMEATHAALLFALEPVWTALFAAVFLSERLSGRDWAGAGLVLLGILVSELPRGRR